MSIPVRIGALLWLLASPLLVRAEQIPVGTVIPVCDDVQEWPPFSYFQRDASLQRTDQVNGYAIDVLNTILGRNGLHLSVQMVAWNRCLTELKEGRTYVLTPNVSYSHKRDTDYLLTRSYYSLHSFIFYSKRRYPDGLPVHSVADLKRYRLCGLLGYNYETYGLKPADMDVSANDFPTLVAKLYAGRCDLFIEKYEIIAGFTALGRDLIGDQALGRAPLPDVPPTPFYMMISRRYPKAAALRELLNDELTSMERSGELQRLWQPYLSGRKTLANLPDPH